MVLRRTWLYQQKRSLSEHDPRRCEFEGLTSIRLSMPLGAAAGAAIYSAPGIVKEEPAWAQWASVAAGRHDGSE